MIIIDVSNNLEPVYLRKYKSGEVRSYCGLFSIPDSIIVSSFKADLKHEVDGYISNSNILYSTNINV